MRVTVFSEFHCAMDARGVVCTNYGAHRYAFWTRYLDVFDEVVVVARLSPAVTDGYPVVGPGVSFHALPDYTGAGQYLRHSVALHRAITSACNTDSAFVLRVPGWVGTLAGRALLRSGTPYGLEVIGDPADVFTRGAVDHPLRPFIRRLFIAELRRLSRHAAAAAYVTATALQQAYPCPAWEIGVADVDLQAAAITTDWKHASPDQARFRIITVGSLAQLYKGTDVLLDAFARCVMRGMDATLVIVGDGRFRAQLQAQAASLGVSNRVEFRGQLPAGAAVRAELDAADLFVLPSRTEGLPRSLIEAMARGLPCIASRVGGIPELLPADDLVTPGDCTELAQTIEAVLSHSELREQMARRCLMRARDFSESQLKPRRIEFYQQVKAASITPSGISCNDMSISARNAAGWHPDR